MEFWALFGLWILTMVYWKISEHHRDKVTATEREHMLSLIKSSSLAEFKASQNKSPATTRNPLFNQLKRNSMDEEDYGEGD